MIHYFAYGSNLHPVRLIERVPSASLVGVIGISKHRLAFHKKDMHRACAQAEIIVEKGYNLFVQPMITVNYTDAELLELISIFLELSPYAFYIVDSFGYIGFQELQRIYLLMNHNLPDDIIIGFHSHNNLQLAYANSIRLVEAVKDRDLIIDSSIFGMGRGAGNLNTEIFADYMNQNYGTTYEISNLLVVIDNYLENIYREKYWGFSVAHFLSAASQCHPNYATYLLSKKTLPVAAVKDLVFSIDKEHKNSFDDKYAEELYVNYQSRGAEDNSAGVVFEKKETLIIASGPSVINEKEKVYNYISASNPNIVCVNHVSPLKIKPDYYFFSNQRRYNEFAGGIEDQSKLILTSNITPVAKHTGCFVVDYHKLYDELHGSSDNVAILLLRFLLDKGIKHVAISGVDGYDVNSFHNYSYKEMNRLNRTRMLQQNEELACTFKEIGGKMRIFFVTSSIFKSVLPLRILGVIPARYQSSRFEGKPLAEINGVPMIKRTYDQAKKADLLNELVVATDSDKIYDYCERESIKVIMTSDTCLTGTDRIAEVAKTMDYDLYVNIQGDEPVISPETIQQIVEAYQQYGDEYVAYNLFK